MEPTDLLVPLVLFTVETMFRSFGTFWRHQQQSTLSRASSRRWASYTWYVFCVLSMICAIDRSRCAIVRQKVPKLLNMVSTLPDRIRIARSVIDGSKGFALTTDIAEL